MLLCVLWKQVINKAQTAPLSKDFNFPFFDVRNHFFVEILSKRAQLSLIALYWLCSGGTNTFGLPKSSICSWEEPHSCQHQWEVQVAELATHCPTGGM